MSYLFAAHAVGAISNENLNRFLVVGGAVVILGFGVVLLYVACDTIKEKFWGSK